MVCLIVLSTVWAADPARPPQEPCENRQDGELPCDTRDGHGRQPTAAPDTIAPVLRGETEGGKNARAGPDSSPGMPGGSTGPKADSQEHAPRRTRRISWHRLQ